MELKGGLTVADGAEANSVLLQELFLLLLLCS